MNNNNWTRNMYDVKTSLDRAEQSQKIASRILDPINAVQCNECFPDFLAAKQGVSYDSSKALIDTNSTILGLNGEFNLQQPNKEFNDCNFRTRYTQFDNSALNLRGTGVNRFNILFENPQNEAKWFCSRIGQNTKNIAIDNYIQVIPKV